MKRKIFLMAALILASMQMVFAQDNLEWFPATGAKNMGFKHKISYGEYQTSRVKVKEETSSTQVLGVTVKETHQMHYKFEQMVGETAAKVEVCENELPEGINEWNKVFNLHLGDSLSFVASIALPDKTVWAFACDVSGRDQGFNCGSPSSAPTAKSLSPFSATTTPHRRMSCCTATSATTRCAKVTKW